MIMMLRIEMAVHFKIFLKRFMSVGFEFQYLIAREQEDKVVIFQRTFSLNILNPDQYFTVNFRSKLLAMESRFELFARQMVNPVKFRLFLLTKLPSAYFSGVRIKSIDENKCEVTVPFKWFSQNPFRSTYFACLSMAAEMSTGALALGHLYKREPVSMLVVKTDGEYFKKAVDTTTFICEEGSQIKKMIEESISTGEPRTVKVKSIGRNKAGEVVADFYITWSFKAKQKK